MKYLQTILLTLSLLICTPQISKAVSPGDIIGYVVSKITSLGSKEKIQELVCRKAKFPFKYSIRSASGIACKETKIALLALTLCKDYDDFNGSGCDTNARKIFSNISNPASVMIDAVKRDFSITGKAFCMVGRFVPLVGDVVNGVCSLGEVAADAL